MAKKVFKTDLSSDGIERLIKELQGWERTTLQDKTRELAERLSKEGVTIAKSYVVSMSNSRVNFSGELESSIHSVFEGSANGSYVYCIRADSEHAAFFEFGTGYGGKFQPYQGELPDGVNWQYLVGDQIIANIQKGIYGWFYKGSDGKIYFTRGIGSRPFMNNTFNDILRTVEKLAREIFRND